MNTIKTLLVVLFVLTGTFASTGCKPEKNLDESVAAVKMSQGTGGRDSGDSPVVATIGDREIRFSDVTGNLDDLPVFVRMRYKAPERRLEFLEAYLEFQVTALAAEAEGLARDPVVVDLLKQDLAARHVRDSVDLKLRSTDIPEQEIRAWYDAHPYEFSRPEQKRVHRILLADKAQAERVSYRVRAYVDAATGDPLGVFKEHVAKSSIEPGAAASGGDIGWFPWAGDTPAPVPAAVAAAAEAMDVLHSVSEPILAEDGWSVLFLAAKRPPVQKDIDQARTEIAGIILDQRRIDARRAMAASLIDPLVAAGKVSINRELLGELAASDAAARKNPGSENGR